MPISEGKKETRMALPLRMWEREAGDKDQGLSKDQIVESLAGHKEGFKLYFNCPGKLWENFFVGE